MGKLSDKQSAFVREYLVDLNATQAAIRAGYSAKTAEWIGPQLLGKTHVSAEIYRLMAERSARVELKSDRVLKVIHTLTTRLMPGLSGRLPVDELPVLLLDRPGSLELAPAGREWPGLAPEAPAYLIHTSGSTGCPWWPGTCTIGQSLGLVDTPPWQIYALCVFAFIIRSMKTAKIILVILLCAGVLPVSAQVYKCRTPSGGTLISDHPCQGGSKTEKVRQAEPVTYDQQVQAAEVQARRKQQIEQMQAEDAAYRSRLAAQSSGMSEEQQRYRDKLCQEASTPHPGAQGRLTAAQRSVLASCSGGGAVPPVQAPASASAVPSPSIPAVITSCDVAGCWDSRGNRYNNAAGGNSYRQDGRLCRQVGNVMQCN